MPVQFKYLKNIPTLTQNHAFDLVMAGLGPEPRSKNIAEKYTPSAPLKICIKEGDVHENDSYTDNSQFFAKQNYQLHQANEIYSLLSAAYTSKSSLSVLIDISCFYRPYLADVLFALTQLDKYQEIEVTLAYSLAQFSSPQTTTYPNEAIEPVHDFFSGWPSSHSYPTSLIIGLGYEPHKAEGASEYLDAGEQWAFIPTSQIPEFLSEVECNNEHLIERLKSDGHIVKYDVHDSERTFGQLELVLSDLLRTTNPVLLPFGPKIFFSLCLIHGILHPEVGIWHVTGENNFESKDIQPSGVEIIYKIGLSVNKA